MQLQIINVDLQEKCLILFNFCLVIKIEKVTFQTIQTIQHASNN